MAGLHPACGHGCAVVDNGDRMAVPIGYKEAFFARLRALQWGLYVEGDFKRFRAREAKRLAVSQAAIAYPTPEPLASAAAGVGLPSSLSAKEAYRLWSVYTGRVPAATGVEWEAARRWAMATYPWPYLPPNTDPPEPDMTAAIRDVARRGG